MKTKYIPALVMLVAGAITAILNILHHADNMFALKSLLFTLVIFFIIGQIAKGVLESVDGTVDMKDVFAAIVTVLEK